MHEIQSDCSSMPELEGSDESGKSADQNKNDSTLDALNQAIIEPDSREHDEGNNSGIAYIIIVTL